MHMDVIDKRIYRTIVQGPFVPMMTDPKDNKKQIPKEERDFTEKD